MAAAAAIHIAASEGTSPTNPEAARARLASDSARDAEGRGLEGSRAVSSSRPKGVLPEAMLGMQSSGLDFGTENHAEL